MRLSLDKENVFGVSQRYRLSRALSTVLVLSLIQIVAAPILAPILSPQAQAATLSGNLNNFVQYNDWLANYASIGNHRPYFHETTNQISSNDQEIKLTSNVGGKTGSLWNETALTGDLIVSAQYWFGDSDAGADGSYFKLMPKSNWPNGGSNGTVGTTQTRGGVANTIFISFDTYQNAPDRAEDHVSAMVWNGDGSFEHRDETGLLLKDNSGNNITQLEGTGWRDFTIKWTMSTKTLDLYSGALNSTQHLIKSWSFSGQTATEYYWGWSGETGGASNDHSIREVNYHIAPTVSSSEADRTVVDGTSVTLSASFTSSETSPTRRWEYSTDGGSTWTSTGSSDSTYTFTASRSLTQRKYRFYVESTAVGVTYSKSTTPITLTVLPPTLNSETDTALTASSAQHFYASNASKILPGTISTLSLEAWVKPGSSCDGNNFCTVFSVEYGFLLDVYQGKISYIIGSGSAWCNSSNRSNLAGTSIPSNQWSHIALVRNLTNVKIFVNGALVSNVNSSCSPTSMTASSSYKLGIGSRNGTSEFFSGQIDEAKIWTTDRSASITSDMNSNQYSVDGLIGYWNFNEGTGSVAYNQVRTGTSFSDLTSDAATPENLWNSLSISASSAYEAYTVRTFYRSYITANGGWKVPAGVTQTSALVIAGGGGGGSDEGGGGGGGGFLESTLTSLNSSYLTVEVGQGGLGAYGGDELTKGANGQNSVFSTLTAIGGGGGGSSVNTNGSSLRTGALGGSGGGGAGENFTPNSGGLGTAGQGFKGGDVVASSTARGAGGGGAGGAGGATGAGGAGKSSSITGTPVLYAGGGGGGHGNTAGGNVGAGGTGGGGTGGDLNTPNTNGTPNTGGGGGGGCGNIVCGDWNSAYSGASGGSGIIIIRWITASAPIYTPPVAVDTTTAGLRKTFQMSGSANSPLIRNYIWQFSSDTQTSWTTLQASTSDSYTTTTLETTTSGSRYSYRVIVTDSDTAGLSISDSSTFTLVINPRITITGSSVSLTQKYGETQTVTYTIANGTGTRTTVASPNNRTGITWSSVSGDSATIGIGPGLGFGTYYETLTVTDSATATTTQMITISISKADTITVTNSVVTMTYSGAQAASGYTITGLKNSETATVTVTYTGASPTVLAPTTSAPANAGTYYATPSAIVLSAGGSTNNYQNVVYESATVTINKANQAPLIIGQYDAYPGISNYPLNVYGGTGLGAVTRTLVSSGTANCTLSNSMFLTAANQGTCSVRAVKSGGINYFDETTTATIYWIQFQTNYSNGAAGGATGITLTGETAIEKRTYETFTVLSFANGSGTAITSASIGSILRIIGTGFNASDSTTEVFLGMTSLGFASLTFNVSDPLANYIQFVVPADAETDRVVMRSSKGWATSPGILTITPIVNM